MQDIEIAVVSIPYAIINPWAMVVVSFDASIANVAVSASLSLN